ncbi:uncharacterized protein LOC135688358 isoform X2 [Rhopilema esculentum]|uniref:uncharacterized protein LOC135688358 isoform X2 n=1 Tax=Rhopilema esculentum TaxID=499914 RepID=UPI0031D742B9
MKCGEVYGKGSRLVCLGLALVSEVSTLTLELPSKILGSCYFQESSPLPLTVAANDPRSKNDELLSVLVLLLSFVVDSILLCQHSMRAVMLKSPNRSRCDMDQIM